MKRMTIFTLVLPALLCLIVFSQGCDGKTDEHGHDHGHDHAEAGAKSDDSHAGHVHTPRYNEVVVEFPGHKYALEIIHDETTGLVTAFLTNAHFEPVTVDAQEVQLNFVIAGSPKSFTLTREPQEPGKPATLTLTDMQLATLICDGWEGNASATIQADGSPYTSKLVKAGSHDHDHNHAH